MTGKMTINFKNIVPENVEEKIFFDLLLKFKKLIYDWGYDILWVLENYDDEKKSKNYSMTGENFIQRTTAYAITAADIVYTLLCNGIDVEIRNCKSSFKTEEAKDIFMNELREAAKKNIR